MLCGMLIFTSTSFARSMHGELTRNLFSEMGGRHTTDLNPLNSVAGFVVSMFLMYLTLRFHTEGGNEIWVKL